ncbi:acyl-CoA thioesterase [Camelimonas abortus]|uniref:Acyl-CoA thioesterase n=1 Tax=Camelimonas abortus TaxID=1017184 RepID=A0ABV7LAL6_9HYPH
MKPPVWRLERSVYPHFVRIQTRYRDEDRLHHINNIAIAEYYDEARSVFTREMFAQAGVSERTRIVTADSRVTYLAEVFHMQPVEIATGILRIGGSSYEIGQALFVGDSCKGVCATVFVHAEKTGATPMPAQLRAALETMRIRVPQPA